MHEILRVMEAAYTPVCRIYPVYRYAHPVIELTRFCMQDEYVNPLFCDPKLFQHPDIFRTDVLGTLAVLGDQPEWLRDCKASMRAAVLCIGRVSPIHLPRVLRDHIICEVLLAAVGEALIDMAHAALV